MDNSAPIFSGRTPRQLRCEQIVVPANPYDLIVGDPLVRRPGALELGNENAGEFQLLDCEDVRAVQASEEDIFLTALKSVQ